MAGNKKGGLNDFVLRIATVNGTGSASANGLLMKAIFRMGIPVSAKNFFPSNIQGLPTWFEIRVNKDSHLALAGRVDLMVAMNAQSYRQDLDDLSPGGVFIYDDTWPRQAMLDRDDVTVLGVPLSGLCNEHFSGSRTRILMKNIAYLGVLIALLEIDRDVITALLHETFASKSALIEANEKALSLGYDYAKANCSCPLKTRLEPMNATEGHIVIDGNTAAGLGCVYAGATVGAWYPITPSTSLMDSFKAFGERFRKDPETGERRYLLVQAEDELAAMGMVVGAGWAGARAFTATSGPGLSLMSEFLGYAYFTEIPAVLFDVQRTGPSTGMPTRTQQSDIIAAAYASHGDTRHVLLFPANPKECFDLAVIAFDLAEGLQTPVIVLSDLDIGMNDWMVPKLEWDEAYAADRGKLLTSEQLDAVEVFHRYDDVHGDGVPLRSVPGVNPKGAFFTRGSGHTRTAAYTEDAAEYKDLVDRLTRKWYTAAERVPAAVMRSSTKRSSLGVLAIGSSDDAVREALDELAEQGVHLDYCRPLAFPFGDDVESFLASHEQIFVLEQNRDAQLKALLVNETACAKDKLISVRHYDGMPISANVLIDAVREHSQKSAAA
ncbi:MAG: 2-oxoglutarate ferredoxin oxidoreductase subunit alpha [Gammaproteobacteria bacterium]